MPFPLHDTRFVNIPFRVGSVQRIHHHSFLGSQSIPVISRIPFPHPNHERDVTQINLRSLTGMPCHHGSGSPTIRHTGSHTPHAVTPCRITQQIHLIRVHVHHHDRRPDQLVEKLVQPRLKPHIPIIPRRPGCHVHTLRRLIQLNLILPLLRIHSLRGASPAMHGNIKTPPVCRFHPEHLIIKRHPQPLPTKTFPSPHSLVFLLHLFQLLVKQQSRDFPCLLLIQRLLVKSKFIQRFSFLRFSCHPCFHGFHLRGYTGR